MPPAQASGPARAAAALLGASFFGSFNKKSHDNQYGPRHTTVGEIDIELFQR